MDLMRTGPITGLVRLEKTRFEDLDPVAFATIDGERYHEVPFTAELGDELEIWKEDATSRPIACALRWVLQQAAGYMKGDMSGVTREGVAAPQGILRDPGLTIRTSRAFLKDPARPGITPYGAGADVEIIAGAFAGQTGHIHEVDGMTAVVRTGDRDEWTRHDAILRVGRESREKEAAFHEEHGMSSAEYFHESGYSDADDERAFLERAAEEAAQEDEEEYGEAQDALEEELDL